MAITIKVGRKKEEITLQLEARRTLDGNILIYDHNDMDIALMLKEKKILTFPKNHVTDDLYDSQSRLFEFLRQKGLIILDSIRGGNIYGSIEAAIAESQDADYDTLSYVLYGIFRILQTREALRRLY